MLTILGAIIGLLSSALPTVIKLWQSKQDYAHEIQMYQLTMQSNAVEHQYKVEELNVNADISESQAIYKAAEIKLTGVGWIDGICALFNYSVRPLLTYMFFVFYGLAKYAQYTMIRTASTTALTTWQAIDKLYGSEDMALFATVIGFWFGMRSVKYAMGQFCGSGVSPTPMALKNIITPSIIVKPSSTSPVPKAFQ